MHTSRVGTAATTRVKWDKDEPEIWAIRIDINAAYIWPLLTQQYSVSEKTAVSFHLVKLILHELAVSWNQKGISIVASADETTAQHAARCK